MVVSSGGESDGDADADGHGDGDQDGEGVAPASSERGEPSEIEPSPAKADAYADVVENTDANTTLPYPPLPPPNASGMDETSKALALQRIEHLKYLDDKNSSSRKLV